MRARLSGLWARCLAACFQARCLGCRSWGPAPVCLACSQAIPAFPPDACPGCRGSATPCPLCLLPAPFSRVYAAAPFEGLIRRAVHALKFEGRRELAGWLGASMQAALPPMDPDWLLVPVPLSRERLRQRGYNQAECLARQIRGFALEPHALRRLRCSPSQVGQGREERWEGLRNAFDASARVHGQRILLVDDVLTTGATLAWAASALREAGARDVRALVAGRAQLGKKTPPGQAEGRT